MAAIQQFSLRWNNYLRHVTTVFDDLRTNEDLVDVTLCCEGRKIKAHKMLLSACSSYFREIFKENPCQHPVIIFRNVKFEDLLGIINFMYHGEVSIAQEQLASFLTTAELLEVQGLTDDSEDNDRDNVGEVETVKDVRLRDIPRGTKQLSRKRKAVYEESEHLWDNGNMNNITGLENINTDCKMKFEHVDVEDDDSQTEVQDNIPSGSTVLSAEEDTEICDSDVLQSSGNILSELKSSNAGLSVSEDSMQDLTTDATLKDVAQGVFNWKIIPLQATDILPENIFANKTPSPCKKLSFDSKLETIDKNKLQTGTVAACNMCDKVFKHPMSLSHHKKIHKQSIVCKVCSKQFSRYYNLLRHVKTSHSSLGMHQ